MKKSETLLGQFLNSAPVRYSSGRSSGVPFISRNGRSQQMRAMESVSTLFSVVDSIANSVSQVEWHLWRTAPSGRKEDREMVTTPHAALNVWNKPNPFFTRQEFVETFVQHLELTGESEWLVDWGPFRAAGPLELWPIMPDRMEPVPHPEEFLAGWIYKGPDGEKVPLDLDEVIQLRRPHPNNMHRGLSAVSTLFDVIGSSKAAEEYNRAFFENSAEPGGIIEIEKHLQDEEFNELRDRWNDQHKGVSKAHRVAILEQGKWKDRTVSMRDMQFVQLHIASRNQIEEAWRIHPHIMGRAENVNRANAEAADATYAQRLVVPRLERIKQALNFDFLPMFGTSGQGVEFDYDNPVPADRQTEANELTAKTNAAAALVNAGYEPAGVLSAMGLPEIAFVGKAGQEA